MFKLGSTSLGWTKVEIKDMVMGSLATPGAATAAVACCETYCFDSGAAHHVVLAYNRGSPIGQVFTSSEKDRKLHLSMYGKTSQLEKQMDAKLAWFLEKYSCRTHGGVGCSSSQADYPLTDKELHQLRMDEEALRETLEEEAMNKKAQEERIRKEQAKNDTFFLEFGVVRYDSKYKSSD
ncbi:hypothetical protein Tco_0008899 [Tanacetum coccineum]